MCVCAHPKEKNKEHQLPVTKIRILTTGGEYGILPD